MRFLYPPWVILVHFRDYLCRFLHFQIAECSRVLYAHWVELNIQRGGANSSHMSTFRKLTFAARRCILFNFAKNALKPGRLSTSLNRPPNTAHACVIHREIESGLDSAIFDELGLQDQRSQCATHRPRAAYTSITRTMETINAARVKCGPNLGYHGAKKNTHNPYRTCLYTRYHQPANYVRKRPPPPQRMMQCFRRKNNTSPPESVEYSVQPRRASLPSLLHVIM